MSIGIGLAAEARVAARLGMVCLAFGSLFTALAWFAPGFDVAYGSSDMHVAVEMTAASVGVVVGVVALGRFRRAGRFGDLALALAIGFIAPVTNAFLLALPTVLNYGQIRVFSVWSSQAAIVAASAVLAAGGLRSRRVVATRRRALLVSYTSAAALLALISGLVLHFESVLPRGLDPSLSPVAIGRQPLTGDPWLLAGQAITAVLLALAAAGFLRGLDRDAGPLSVWAVPALTTGSLAALNYLLFPTLYSYWVYTGDILQLAVWLLFIAAILGQVRAYAHGVVEAAVLDERRRLARDLHDGVAQELAFIATGLRELPDTLAPSLASLKSSAERAMHESRRAIAALTEPLDQPFELAVAEAVGDVLERAGVRLRVEVEQGSHLPAERREVLLRVAREAAVNAVRHGRPRSVAVKLSRRDGMMLEVRDDGCGFDPASPPRGGFGLTSMRERVEREGGCFNVRSARDSGTIVEARWRAGE